MAADALPCGPGHHAVRHIRAGDLLGRHDRVAEQRVAHADQDRRVDGGGPTPVVLTMLTTAW